MGFRLIASAPCPSALPPFSLVRYRTGMIMYVSVSSHAPSSAPNRPVEVPAVSSAPLISLTFAYRVLCIRSRVVVRLSPSGFCLSSFLR